MKAIIIILIQYIILEPITIFIKIVSVQHTFKQLSIVSSIVNCI